MPSTRTGVISKTKSILGTTPAIALVNPKYTSNVGAAIRAASAFGAKQVWYTGNRLKLDTLARVPREFRMKEYQDIQVYNCDHFFDAFPKGTVPIAVEVKPGAISLPEFEHPPNALYIFGPEDGSLDRKWLQGAHALVSIPTRHCINLSAAVYLTLYDRATKLNPMVRLEDILQEDKSWVDTDSNDDLVKVLL